MRVARPSDGTLLHLCQATLKKMDFVGIFTGVFTGRVKREQLVLGIYMNSKYMTEEKFVSWAEPINPPSVIERLRREIEEGRAAGQIILPPPDTEEADDIVSFPPADD